MLRFLADENFDKDIVRGLRVRRPDLDVVRVQDVGLSGYKDQDLLEWAAKVQRLILTHDVGTMTKYAYDRVTAGLSMPGVVEIQQDDFLGKVIDDVLLLAECSRDDEWEGQVIYLPL